MFIKMIGTLLRATPPFRGKDFLTRTFLKPLLTGRNREIEIPVASPPDSNLKLLGRIDDWIPWNVYVHGYYPAEKNHERFMLEKASSCSVIFDIGANIGYYTLKFSQSVTPEGRVYAFEPVSYQHDTLQKNLVINGIDNVDVIRSIVSDSNEVRRIYFSGMANTGASSVVKETDIWEDISSVTVDDFCGEHGISRIDLIKIDVEGHEMSVLAGMKKMLEHGNVRRLFVEISEENLRQAGSSSEKICRFMGKWGYHPFAIGSGKMEVYKSGTDDSLLYFTRDTS